jgi:predicted metal-binding membrane protein
MVGLAESGARAVAASRVSRSDRRELAAAFAAIRSRWTIVVLLLALTAVAWWSTADRMAGMDAGPGTDLGAFGWFLGVWTVMMAAMMLPSLAPTVAVYSSMSSRRRASGPFLFAAGYVLVWGAVGACAYGLFELGRSLLGVDLAWHRAGRWFAAGVLVAAALYELTPLKDSCLMKCRTPAGFMRSSWRDGSLGALAMGARNGVWCLGCCWALMAVLFALGVMSLTWMVLVAAVVALQKLLPWRRAAAWATAALLLALAVTFAASPGSVPGLVVPGSSPGAMHATSMMR